MEETIIAVFEQKILRICGTYIESKTKKWKVHHNEELKNLLQILDIITEIKRKRRICPGHGKKVWRKEGLLIKTIIEKDPIRKKPLGRPRLQ